MKSLFFKSTSQKDKIRLMALIKFVFKKNFKLLILFVNAITTLQFPQDFIVL